MYIKNTVVHFIRHHRQSSHTIRCKYLTKKWYTNQKVLCHQLTPWSGDLREMNKN